MGRVRLLKNIKRDKVSKGYWERIKNSNDSGKYQEIPKVCPFIMYNALGYFYHSCYPSFLKFA